ncbi:MAG: TldD/PmbA family protein [Spirochaetales bacterium]|nr:TldD/PmbA family protein [Spirochaetales bacterium]
MQDNRSLSVAFVKGNLMRNDYRSESGVSARVFRKGLWGFASHPELVDPAVTSVLKSAADNAGFLSSKVDGEDITLDRTPVTSHNDFSTNKPRLNRESLVAFVKEIDNYIETKLKPVSSRTVSLRCLDMEKSVVTSYGSRFYSMIPRSNIIVSLTVSKDGQPVDLYEVFGGLGQFEDVFHDPSDLFREIDILHEHLVKKCEGVFPQAGCAECVLDSSLAGILAHEALGHTTEADIILGGSVAPDYMGKEAASPLITLIDFAHTALEETCPVPVYVDDEGTKGEDAVIIEKGILKGYLHSKETAAQFNHAPTGNARAYSFSDEPLIRMRNTAILPGGSTLEEMIDGIEDGYYLLKTSNGQADSTGEFTFGITLGYEIKGGRLKRAIKDTTISGIAFDVLKTVSMVSKDMTWINGGFCGKKQLIPVGMGGPAIKCKVTIGGK